MSSVNNWTPDQLPDLAGRTYFITGANGGLGYETAKHLRRANADVIVGARSLKKGTDAVASLSAAPGAGSVELVEIDLADSASIRAANAAVRELADGLDAMINNAGVMQTPEMKTADGFELQFGTNHLGHFLLNSLVFDLVKARGGRIVPVSSVAHRQPKGINFDNVMMTGNYSATNAYGQSKLANIMYGLELAKRLDQAGSDVRSMTCHPGYSATNLQSSGPTGIFKMIYKVSNKLMAQSAEDGAISQVLSAAGDEAKNGAYYGPTKLGDARGPVGESKVSDPARDSVAASRLWKLSEELLGINFDVS